TRTFSTGSPRLAREGVAGADSSLAQINTVTKVSAMSASLAGQISGSRFMSETPYLEGTALVTQAPSIHQPKLIRSETRHSYSHDRTLLRSISLSKKKLNVNNLRALRLRDFIS